METQSAATATAPILVSTIQNNAPQHSDGRDPMEIRWGINFVREKLLDGNRTGFGILPFAKFFPLARFQTREEVHSTDETMERERAVTKTARDVEMYLNEMLAARDSMGNPAVGQPHWGFQVEFYGDMDAGKMGVLSETLLPKLSKIREVCAELKVVSPIAAKCEGQDEFDFEERESCPTCWARWIDSDACQAYIKQVSKQGMAVAERDSFTQEITQRIVSPSLADFETARKTVQLSLNICLGSLGKDWTTIATELDKGERKDVTTYQHGIRKDLHQSKPQDRQLKMVEAYGKAAAGGGSDMTQLIATMAQQTMQTNQLLAALVKQGVPQMEQQAPLAPVETVQTEDATPNEPELSPAALEMKNKKKP